LFIRSHINNCRPSLSDRLSNPFRLYTSVIMASRKRLSLAQKLGPRWDQSPALPEP
jgi:hypothetical protein